MDHKPIRKAKPRKSRMPVVLLVFSLAFLGLWLATAIVCIRVNPGSTSVFLCTGEVRVLTLALAPDPSLPILRSPPPFDESLRPFFEFEPVSVNGLSRLGLTLPSRYTFMGSINLFVIPIWMPTVLIVITTISSFYLRSRRQAGQCITCKYDLRGNISGICPECGTRCA